MHFLHFCVAFTAEALRRTSTYCEFNHRGSRCLLISPSSTTIPVTSSGDHKQDGESNVDGSNRFFESCPILSACAKSANLSSKPDASLLLEFSSPWNPPFYLSDAFKNSLVKVSSEKNSNGGQGGSADRIAFELNDNASGTVECPVSCFESAETYVYYAGKARHGFLPFRVLALELLTVDVCIGCCAAAEDAALKDFWAAVSHPLYR